MLITDSVKFSKPFPHVLVEDYWPPSLLRRVLGEMPPPTDPRWVHYDNAREKKLAGNQDMWGAATFELFDDIAALAPKLSRAFGVPKLVMETIGGGYHYIEPGGVLDVHTDFNRSPDTGRYRRLNFIIYLNSKWREPDEAGHLELWDDKQRVKRIAPEFNRTVIFESSSRSWHGHPRRAQRPRASIAAYFFSDIPPKDFTAEQSTVWHPSITP